MRIKTRVGLLAAGAFTAVFGLSLWHRGVFVYQNTWFRGTSYSASTIAFGIFLVLLAFLPPTAWVERWTPRKKNPEHQDHPAYHQRHHGPNNYSAGRTDHDPLPQC
jgi:hypothetical protein